MKTLIASACGLRLSKITCRADRIILELSPSQFPVLCPRCQQPVMKIHSRYERTLADLPWESIDETE